MGIFISVPKTVECVLAALIFSAAYCATFVRPFGILQSAGYSGKKLFGWAGKKGNAYLNRAGLLLMLCALAYSVIALCFSFAGEWAAVIGFAAFPAFFVLYAVADKKIALRSPAVFTPRMKRLYILTSAVATVFIYLCIVLLNFADYLYGNDIFRILRYCPMAVFPLLTLPTVALSNLISKIYETPHNKKFVKTAKAKLKAAQITVVGITGSYGKTSVKHILAAILSHSGKYRVLSTPRSHNTPLGLALTLNSADLSQYDVFIAEMGARHMGDIAELCEMCPPDYSLITGICPQHLESFKSEENIVKAKGEILASTRKKAVIAADCAEKFGGYGCEKIVADCVSCVECAETGTTFNLTLGGQTAVVKTALLGMPAARNIGIAACLAFEMGISLNEIVSAAAELGFVEHRLQLIKSNGVNIIDDGYNSNIKGAQAALDVLRLFGGDKIAVTPGLVEMGILEESENYSLGKKLVGLDRVILVGETLITPVRRGYLENGGDSEKIVTVPTLSAAQEKLKEFLKNGDTVLFLNDLPDIYM